MRPHGPAPITQIAVTATALALSVAILVVLESTRRDALTPIEATPVDRPPTPHLLTRAAGPASAGGVPVPRTAAAQALPEPVEWARVATPATRIGRQIVVDPFAPLKSPSVGNHCATGVSSADLAAFFAAPIGPFQGADYQRAHRLPDDRVLWTFQDAFIDGRLVHNAALIQSGRCFTLLNRNARSWLFADLTTDLRRWHWILDGGALVGRDQYALFVVEMHETGTAYLTRTRPVRVRRVVLDVASLSIVSVHDEAPTGEDLYGWSVTSDADHTYLYSHCYQQFGYTGQLGFGPCVADVKVARVPLGELAAAREYWDGTGWVREHTLATPVVDGAFVMSGNNPAQIRFDGARYVLVEKRDDWFGKTVEFGISATPTGPFRPVASLPEPLACDRSVCNTYFASWIPWRDPDGSLIWSVGRNVWNGANTASQLDRYRPTFASINLAAS